MDQTMIGPSGATPLLRVVPKPGDETKAVLAPPPPANPPKLEDLAAADELAVAVMDSVAKFGYHPEYKAFENAFGASKIPLAPTNSPSTTTRSTVSNFGVWELIDDSVEGRGGYTDGSYLVPHELEWDPSTPSGFSRKFLERMAIARYDNFAKVISDGPWNSIMSMRDMIQRDGSGNARLEQFWDDVDGNGTDIVDFLEYPASQARKYGTAWIVVDRDSAPVESEQKNQSNNPYAFVVPTRNVVWWEIGWRGELLAVAYRDVDPDDYDTGYVEDLTTAPLRIWTEQSWSLWQPTDGPGFILQDWGPNRLGQVPCVQVFDGRPAPGKAFGRSNMIGIARIALDVFNRDSEMREIERRTAFPMLHVSVDDIAQANKVTVGMNGVIATDGKTAPSWLEPSLESLTKMASERQAAKDDAFVMSEMTGLLGHTNAMQTSSGFHAEVEIDKSERRIGQFAASIESAENAIGRLFLAYVGLPQAKFSVTYPRKFGLTNIDTIVERTQNMLALNLGPQDTEETLRDYYQARYPRKKAGEIELLAKTAAAYRMGQPPLGAVQEFGVPPSPRAVPAADLGAAPPPQPGDTNVVGQPGKPGASQPVPGKPIARSPNAPNLPPAASARQRLASQLAARKAGA